MNKKILIVDDDEGILDAVEALLEANGYEVEISLNGEILEHLSKGNLPDVILLDILLSGRDGREICKKLKKHSSTKNVPVIIFSADPRAEEGAKAAGANEFIAKPFEMNELLEKIDRCIKNHKLHITV